VNDVKKRSNFLSWIIKMTQLILTVGNFEVIKEKPKHFSIGSDSFLPTIAFALVALSTCINIKQDPD
jgi:hypothetical protein